MAEFAAKKFIFIVSSGRTGTKAIAQHLSRCYPQVWAAHEPTPSWRLRMGTTRALCDRISRDDLKEMLARLRRQMVQRVQQNIYVESNPYLSGFIEVLPEVFQSASVVHVVRDPRTYVRSGVNFGAFRGLKKLASQFWPNWFPKSDNWSHMDAIERLAWYWSLVNSHLNRGEAIYGQRYLRIKYEELFSDGLERLTDWIGLERSPALREEANKERVNASHGQLPAFENWSEADQQKVLRHCEPLMRAYGYLKEENAPMRQAVEVS